MEETVEELGSHLRHFGWLDYLVFIGMLVVSCGIGVYYGFFNKTKQTAADYLMGGRNMGTIPVSMSLIASFISGITIVGTPAEVYVYGTQYCVVVFGVIMMGFAIHYVYLPVFYTMKVTSSYEYLERRFNRPVRILGSILFLLVNLTWIPVVIYVPALAFNQVTGVNAHLVTPLVCLVCIFYTTVGGLKAVVWTDVFQTVMMFGSMLYVIVKATMDVGGFDVVWQRNLDSGRLEFFNFHPSPLIRHSFWTVTFGGAFYWIQANSVNQSMVQRYMSIPNLKSSIRAVWIFVGGGISLVVICSYSGLVTYATYYDCDPLTTKLATSRDQLLPLLVMETCGHIPGLPGLFIAGVFSAALSSMSTGLNSMAAVVLEDFCKPFFKKPLTERQTSLVIQLVVIVLGAACVGLVYVVQHLGGVLQVSTSLNGISGGAMLGIFSLGMLFPMANEKGAMAGGAAGLLCLGWVAIGAQSAIASKRLVFEEKVVSIEGCSYNFTNSRLDAFNGSSSFILQGVQDDVFPLYRVSYFTYAIIGVIVVFLVALPVSHFTGGNDFQAMDRNLLSPVIHRFLPKKPKMAVEVSLLPEKTQAIHIIPKEDKNKEDANPT